MVRRVKALAEALVQRFVEISHKPPKEVAETMLYVSGRGGGAKTYAHPVLALDYAEYLNPAIGVEVREVFIRYREM